MIKNLPRGRFFYSLHFVHLSGMVSVKHASNISIMKKFVLFLFLLPAVAPAQNIQRQSVKFKYTRLPSVPINDGSNQFSVEVLMNYQQKNLDSMAYYENEKANYLKEVETALGFWNQQRDNAQRAYYTQLSQYEQQVNAGNAAAVAPQAPQIIPFTYNKPYPRKPMELKEINTSSVMAAVKVDGMKQSANYPVKVTLTWEGFERGTIQERKTGSGASTKYRYTITYRHPVSLKAEFPGKGIILNERINATEQMRSFQTQDFKTSGEFKLWWIDNQEKFWQERQDQVVMQNMQDINTHLNDRFGYTEMWRNTDIFTIKSKDYDYSDFQKAYQAAQDGMNKLIYKDKQTQAQQSLLNAVNIYNTILQESDLNNKKARVDKWVTAATYVNIAECYMWLNDFSNAEISMSKAEDIDINKYNRECRELKRILADQKMRAEAANK